MVAAVHHTLWFCFQTLHVDGSEMNYLAVSGSTNIFSASISAFG
ncbi:hypothetical protein BN4901_0436 [Citrobacter europaeus]|uniref:Uncharacterized protein n=1 Tax=Citrobacter europaeus TaxID=1914243 RepID=A0ABY0JWN4_9ENTR|nr:hypothetical protein CIP106467_4810 [Citrobacter europaeus]SCA74571.1 hypothetical protein BN4901_0436 [Citrobacter europaeus]